jgi:AAA+ ATPase superfamily predicted ATPase
MITKFIDRESDLKALNIAYNKPSFNFYPIYGRRRTGKTELIKQFIKDKPHIYFLATEGTEKENITNFKHAAKHIINIDFLTDDFEAIFQYIIQNPQRKIVIVIDEFPFLIKANKAISSKFQHLIDEYLSKTNCFLILCGSSVGMMFKEVLGYRAPLYWRKTGQIEVRPLLFDNARQLLDKPIEECVRIYGACGGIPFYLKEFVEKKDFFQLVDEKVLSPETLLNKEAIFLLREELDEISRYASILSAISLGNTKVRDIMNYCGFKERLNIAPYLNVLERLGIIEKEIPITSSLKARGIYKIKDQFFRFYFQYVRPNESILTDDRKEIVAFIKKDYDAYLGKIFEDIAKEFIQKKLLLSKVGTWWYQEEEIDIVSLNENTKEIFFFECKWKDLTLTQAQKILDKLQEKTQYVDWYNKKRKEQYGIVARQIEQKERLHEKGFLVYDLKDWNKTTTSMR